MPLCSLYLISLKSPIPTFLSTLHSTLHSTPLQPLLISKVLRWIILPTILSTSPLLAQNIHWDILLITPGTSPLPQDLQSLIHHQWRLTAGIPSTLLKDFSAKNHELLHPSPETVPKLHGLGDTNKFNLPSSSQNLELSPDLHSWIHAFHATQTRESRGAVSMLNLLAFKPGMKPSYLNYGRAFADSVGARRGGNAKIVGTVVSVEGEEEMVAGGGWDEVAVAHYPSILHFAEMLAAEDYQAVNRRWRVPALRDTFILCTSEIGIEEVGGERRATGKL
ncbi:hypothetical protein BDV95DRAFT_598786 [Massariosphaeria phaeospora]|uniref:DUF1330 domain-containing protein n=1 Tax=Massariosphaeria phaeospora TaxID=100035 RepID=A0A7C8I2U0_9PLEO|nr:hypothetical protein BDV95DRAFT_598786 [Massariosphaeria phaeospora]